MIIWRYELEIDDEVHRVPLGQVLESMIKVIHVSPEEHEYFVEVWVLHDEEPTEMSPTIGLGIFGTGKHISNGWKYVDTTAPMYFEDGRRMVWHVFREEVPQY